MNPLTRCLQLANAIRSTSSENATTKNLYLTHGKSFVQGENQVNYAFDIGGLKMAFVALDATGKILLHSKKSTLMEDCSAFVDALRELIATLDDEVCARVLGHYHRPLIVSGGYYWDGGLHGTALLDTLNATKETLS